MPQSTPAPSNPLVTGETSAGNTVLHDYTDLKDEKRSEGRKDPGTVTPYSDEGREDFENLGELLVYLRLTYGDRLQHVRPGGPRITLSAQAVADYLREHDYSMTSGSYSLLEQGKTLPKNPELFFEIISKGLAVEPTSKYWPLLRYQYLFDHARRYMDREFTEQHVPRGSHVLTLLREHKL